jgi:hypothetical protein
LILGAVFSQLFVTEGVQRPNNQGQIGDGIGDPPVDLKTLYASSELIVDADVVSVFAWVQSQSSGRMANILGSVDAMVRVRQVLKGTVAEIPTIVVGQPGNPSDGHMEPGERYILFLLPVTKDRNAQLPDRGVPRFAMFGALQPYRLGIVAGKLNPSARMSSPFWIDNFKGRDVSILTEALHVLKGAR